MPASTADLSTETEPARLMKSHIQNLAMFAGVLTLALLAFYSPALTGQAHFFMADHGYYFQPFTTYLRDRMSQGQLPLWNPYLYCGMSQLAVPSPGIFYPPNWIFVFTDYHRGLALNLALHQLIAAVGGFLLIASFGWGVLPASICGIAFSLNGYMFSAPNNFSLAETASWLPMVLWSFRAIILRQENSLTDEAKGERKQVNQVHLLTVVAGICVFMLVGAGRPEVSVPSGAILGLWLIVHGRRAIACGAVKWQLLALLIAALFSSLVVLPTFEWIKLSARAHGLNMSQVLMWSTNWYDWISTFFIEPFGDLQRLGADNLPLVATRPVFLPFIPNTYLGPIAGSLAVWGLFDRSWKHRWAVIALLTCSIIMCVGEYSPIAPFIVSHIKALSVFRYPIKWMFVPLLFLSVAAARGLRCVEQNSVDRVAQITVLTVWTSGVVLSLLMLYYSSAKRSMVVPNLTIPASAEPLLANSILIGCGIGFAVCAVQWLAQQQKLFTNRGASELLTGALLVNMMVAAVMCGQIMSPKDFAAKPPELFGIWKQLTAQSPGPQRIFSLCYDPVFVKMDWPIKDVRSTIHYFEYARDVLFPNTNVTSHVPETTGYEAAETSWYRSVYLDSVHKSRISLKIRKDAKESDITGDKPLWRFCQATSTQFVAMQIGSNKGKVATLDPDYFTRRVWNAALDMQVYEVSNPLPRAYFTPLWTWIDNQDLVAQRIARAQTQEFDPTCLTLINRHDTSGEASDKPPSYGAPKLPAPPAVGPTLPDTVTVAPTMVTPVSLMSDQPEHVSLSVKAPTPGWVVLTDHFYPGWQALVDGVPQLTYKTNVESRAVFIPAGSHLIEYNFEPQCLRIAFLLAGLAAATCLALIAVAVAPLVWTGIRRSAGLNQ